MGTLVSVRFRGLLIHVHIATLFFFWFVVAGVTVQYEENFRTRCTVGLASGLIIAAVIVGREFLRGFLFRRRGTPVRALSFFLVGSFPRIDDDENSPTSEFYAGLLTLLATAFATSLCWLLRTRISGSSPSADVLTITSSALAGILAIQMLPALPFDGGRLLRALLWHLSEDSVRASRGAAVYGHIISAAMIGVGIVLLVQPDAWPYWGLALLVAGLHVVTGSAAAVRDAYYQRLGKVHDLQSMVIGWSRKVQSTDSISKAVAALLAEGDGPPLLVVDNGGTPVGMFTRGLLRKTNRRRWESELVSEVMKPLSEYPSVEPSISIWSTLMILESTGADYALLDEGYGRVRFLNKEMLVRHLDDATRSM